MHDLLSTATSSFMFTILAEIEISFLDDTFCNFWTIPICIIILLLSTLTDYKHCIFYLYNNNCNFYLDTAVALTEKAGGGKVWRWEVEKAGGGKVWRWEMERHCPVTIITIRGSYKIFKQGTL